MRNKTELMEKILQNQMAQKIVDYISPRYGESYVGLWLIEVIGEAIGEADHIARQLKSETNPGTADLLLDVWEDYYGLLQNSALSKEQRRRNLLSKVQARMAFNPTRMEQVLSNALGGVKVEITENVGKNKFLVNIRETVPSLTPAIIILEQRKPAHLRYDIRIATQTLTQGALKTAVAIARREQYRLEVLQ